MWKLEELKNSLKLTPAPVVEVTFTAKYPVDAGFSAVDALQEIERIADEIRGFGSVEVVGKYNEKEFTS